MKRNIPIVILTLCILFLAWMVLKPADAMEICQISHSFDTCYGELN